jgi:hypothetical protein
MRKILSFALVLAGAFLFALLLPESARAQFTTVTARVTDPNGIPYAGATMTALLVPASSGGYTLNNKPYSGQIAPVSLDATGKFSANFGDVTLITPASAQWAITIDIAPGVLGPFGTGPQSFTFTSTGTTISGSSVVNITNSLNALAPNLTTSNAGLRFVAALPALCTPGVTADVQLSVTPFTFNYCSATNTWTALSAGGSGTVTGVAGQTLYFSGTNTAAGGAHVLDMAGIAGADLGAKMNACITQLAGQGTCKGDNLPLSQTLSTAVTTSAAVAFTFCGQQVSQSANVALANANSGVAACPGGNTLFTKAGNIDQFTLSGADSYVTGVSLAGVKASFTGNGIVANGGGNGDGIHVAGNFIVGEAGDCIKDSSGTRATDLIEGNTCTNWGLHGFESTSAIPLTKFVNNSLFGDGTATGAAILDTGCSNLEDNFVQDNNGTVLVDASTCGSNATISGNRLNQFNGWPALNGGSAVITNNPQITGGGANGPSALGTGSLWVGNVFSCSLSDCLDIGGQTTVKGNSVSFSAGAAESNFCAINITGDQLLANVSGNAIAGSDTHGGDTNYGICITSTSGHMLEDIVMQNTIDATDSGGAIFDGIWLNNAGGLTTNASQNVIAKNQCIHTPVCIVRTDAQNNINFFEDNSNEALPIYAAGGSNQDVIVQRIEPLTFATLPTAGFGSQIKCNDCTATTPTAGSGGGAYLTRVPPGPVWSGGMIDGSGNANAATYNTATNCSSSASPAVCGSAAAGSVVIAAAATTVTVNTTAVTANSQITLIADDTLGTKLSVTCNSTLATLIGGLAVTARTAGTSFQITSGATPSVNPLCITYVIEN